MTETKDLTGLIFGDWLVLEYSHTIKYNKSQKRYWLCRCCCGTIKPVQQSNLLSGRSKNCGCKIDATDRTTYFRNMGKNNITHNKSGSRLYIVWSSMKTRCYNKKAQNYKFYGGRGIQVCNEWLNDFMNFYNWALLTGYNPNAKRNQCTIDRINVNGNYEPSNCRWVDMKTQSKNKRVRPQADARQNYN